MYLKHNPCYHCYSGAMCNCYYPEVGFCCELMDIIIDNCDLEYDGYVELNDEMVDKKFIEKYKKDIIFNENELKQYLNGIEKNNEKYKKDIIFNENELKQYLNSLEKINEKSYN